MNKLHKEKRTSGRVRVGIAIEILHESFAGIFAESVDYSEGGVLVKKLPGAEILQTGMDLDLRVSGIMGEPPAVISARVVRIGDDGIAFQFDVPVQALA